MSKFYVARETDPFSDWYVVKKKRKFLWDKEVDRFSITIWGQVEAANLARECLAEQALKV